MNHGIEIKAGTVDRDYNRNVQVILQNNSEVLYTVNKGSRIAQMVIHRIAQLAIKDVDSIHDTQRQKWQLLKHWNY
jgi:dUTP pyrophosphatase